MPTIAESIAQWRDDDLAIADASTGPVGFDFVVVSIRLLSSEPAR